MMIGLCSGSSSTPVASRIVVVAAAAVEEARLVPGAEVRGFAHLHEVIRAFGGRPDGPPPVPDAARVLGAGAGREEAEEL